jgi:Flavodoxin
MSAAATPEQALVVFESMFGNTERIAHAIGDGLRGEGLDVELRNVGSAPQHLPGDYDLLVVGAPTHGFSLSRPSTRSDAGRQGAPLERTATGVREWLQDLSWEGRAPTTAVFDTRVTKVRRLRWAAGRKAAALLADRGLRPTSAPVAFLVADMRGPLEDGELERATAWGRQLAGLIRAPQASTGARDAEA